jgi:4-alpha-glucanotransferase
MHGMLRISIAEGLARLGVRRLLLAIHDVSFPSDPDEDIGRGSPATRAATRLFAYAKSLGFTGIQLGPQGQTSRSNPSPYDSTIFGRHLGNVGLASLHTGGALAGLVTRENLARALEASTESSREANASGGAPIATTASRARHRDAHDTMHAIVDVAWRAFRASARPDIVAPFVAFRTANATWIEREALYLAICETHHGHGFRSWPAHERDLWVDASGVTDNGDIKTTSHEARAATDELVARHADVIERHAFGQFLVHIEHQRVRDELARVGLALYGDLQVGYADADAWAYASVFRRDYLMGAPPSRTNPEGQPWGYPVLDPAQYDGAAKALVVARAEKAFAEYDSIRIDHPHGLICPWVYRADDRDSASAVRAGARLFESPDLEDHPALAAFAIARGEQIDHAQARYADRWVRGPEASGGLDAAQIARYSVLFDALVDSARANGRDASDLSCEVLSTMPTPLEAVLARYDLGRWRITQKANLDDTRDVYRAENAQRQDWVMLGNHDTAPIFALLKTWPKQKRDAWAAHLARTLSLSQPERLTDDGFFATAMLAELFLSKAENVSIFFADLFGLEDRFNVPGLVDDANWSLRLPADFEAMHAERLACGTALDIALAVELALAASEANERAR